MLLLAIAGTIAYFVIKLDVFAPSLSEQVSSIQKEDGSWWLGTTFEGLPIAMAQPAGGDRVDDLGYGACERFGSKLDPFASTRCGYPLVLQVRKRRYDISLDELPKQLDGNCVTTTIRGAPVVVAPGGAILYTADLAIAALGRPEQVGRALAAVRPVNGAARFEPPSPGVDALDNCIKAAHPFAPLRAARRRPGEAAGTAARLGWRVVCGRAPDGRRANGGDSGSHLHELRPQLLARLVSRDALALERAGRPRQHPLDARRSDMPHLHRGRGTGGGVDEGSRRRDRAGVYIFSGRAAISFANDITLEKIPISRVEAVARLVKPLPPATGLPAPTYDTKSLIAGCAEQAPLS